MLLIEQPKTIQRQMKLSKDKANHNKLIKEYEELFKPRYFACDFEATTKEPYTVYMVTIEDINTGVQWAYSTIDEFLQFCEWNPNSVMYFHNGNKYDFEFIINRCFTRPDWRVSTNKTISLVKKLPMFELTPTGRLRKSKGKYVQAETNIILRDTLDVVKGSIESLGKSIGLKKGLGTIETPLVAKINDDGTWIEQTKEYQYIEHKTNFYRDCHKRGWWKYAGQDTHILAEVIKAYDVLTHANNKHYTIAGIAYNEMISNSPEYQSYLKDLTIKAKNSEHFKKYAKVLNEQAKKAYKGGIAFANPMYAENIVTTKHGYHLDYTSMYPGIYMFPEKYPLPTREPSQTKTDLYIIHYKNLRATVKDNKFPVLKLRTTENGPNSRYYLPTFKGDISLTTPENEYLFECYKNITYDSCEVVYYNENFLLEEAMKNHGWKWYPRKEQADKENNLCKKIQAKEMINTCYGYLGFFEKKVGIYKYRLENNVIQKELDKYGYTGLPFAEVPAAAFITAYGRVKLSRDINKIGLDKVICCDTDSLFTVDVPIEKLKKLINIDGKLGNFKIEHTFTKIRAIKAKTWCISNDDGIPLAQATAGSNYKFKHIENFKPGEKILSKTTVRGVGGVGIIPLVKELGVIDKDINEAWG